MREKYMPEFGDWNEWAKRVLGDIEKLERTSEALAKNLADLKIEIVILKTKSIFIGIIAGAIMSIIVGIVSTIVANKLS
jgi:hypothetical protein